MGSGCCDQIPLSGTVASNVLTLSAAAVGPMWEGEVLGCVTYSPSACSIGPLSGVYITSLASGAWGASGSSYNLANATGITISSASPMQNAMYYSGSGPTLFLGTVNDVLEYWNTVLDLRRQVAVSILVIDSPADDARPRAGPR